MMEKEGAFGISIWPHGAALDRGQQPEKPPKTDGSTGQDWHILCRDDRTPEPAGQAAGEGFRKAVATVVQADLHRC